MKKTKILKYGEIDEHIHHNIWDDDDTHGVGGGVTNYTFQSKEEKEKDKERIMAMDISQDDKDTLDTLSELLKRMFLSGGFENVFVGNEGLAVVIQIFFEPAEKLSNIKGIMDILIKIKNDTLRGYDSELVLYETEKDEDPFMEVIFFQRTNKPYSYSPGSSKSTNNYQDEVNDKSNTLGANRDDFDDIYAARNAF